MPFSIKESMDRSHKELSQMLDKAVDGVNLNSKQCEDLFKVFRNRLFKHFNIEERIIFGYDNIRDEQTKQTVRGLLHEHGTMRGMVEDIEKKLKNQKYIDIVPFVDLVNKHQTTEDKVLYPKLDHDLSSEEKDDMEEQISKILKQQ